MSDWFGSHSTAPTVNAGLDLEMPGPPRDRGAKLVAAVRGRRGRRRHGAGRASLDVLRADAATGALDDPGRAAPSAPTTAPSTAR